MIEETNDDNNCSEGIAVSSTSAFAPQDQQEFNVRMVDKRLHAETFFVDFFSQERFLESYRYAGNYDYTGTDDNTGTLVETYDNDIFGGSCTLSMTFESEFTGMVSYTCESGDESDVESMYFTDSLIAPAPVIFALTLIDSEIQIALNAPFAVGETKAIDYQLRRRTPRTEWDDFCQEFTNQSSEAIVGTARVNITELSAGTTYEARYRFRNSSSCEEGEPNLWSVVGTGTTSGEVDNNGLVFPDGDTTERTLVEHTLAGIDVGPPVATLGGENLTYSLSGADANSYNIVGEIGQIRTKEGVLYDFETQDEYEVTVDVTDGDSNASIDVTIEVADLSARCESTDTLVVDGVDEGIRLRWQPVLSDSDRAQVLGYETSIREGEGNWKDARRVLGGDVTGAVYSALTNGQSYEVRVRSFNSEQGCFWSDSVPATPTSNHASATASQFFERLGRRSLGTDEHNLTFFSVERCRYNNGETSHDANCVYSNTDESTATINLEFDDRSIDSCAVNLTYSSTTTGSFADECDSAHENPTVSFDTAFRLPDLDSEATGGGTVSKAPRSPEEFDSFVWNRADLIPGLGFGCMPGYGQCDFLPDSRFAYRVDYDSDGTGRDIVLGRYEYRNTGVAQGILTFTEETGRSWNFTLDFERSGNVQMAIDDTDGYAMNWSGVPHLDLMGTSTTLRLPLADSWLVATSRVANYAPDDINDLVSLIPTPTNDSNSESTGRSLLEKTLMRNVFDMAYDGPNPYAISYRFRYKTLGPNRAVLTMVWERNHEGDLSDSQEVLLGSTWTFNLDFIAEGAARTILSVSKEGAETSVLHYVVDFAGGDSTDADRFPDELLPPRAAPQAPGEDLSGVEIAAARTIVQLSSDDLLTFIVKMPDSETATYSAGDWIEPKDGANQRMMIVGTGQTEAVVPSMISKLFGIGFNEAGSSELQVLSVVCMQRGAELPTRGARYFSKSKSAATTVELCQQECVLNEEEGIQGCVWECETTGGEESQQSQSTNFAYGMQPNQLLRDISRSVAGGKNIDSIAPLAYKTERRFSETPDVSTDTPSVEITDSIAPEE